MSARGWHFLRGWRRTASAGGLAAALLCGSARSWGQDVIDPGAGQTAGVALTDKTNAVLPLEIELRDEEDRAVKLGDYFQADRPVIVALVYYQCPGMCGIVLNDLVQTVKRMESLELGKQYAIVTVSFDPKEKPALAKAKKGKFMNLLALPGSAARTRVDSGWCFLTGTDANVRQLADAVGFGYRWDEAGGQYLHPAAIFICTPQGKLSRVIQGVGYQADAGLVKDSLVDASAGRIGSPILRAALFCGVMKYNAASGRYEQNPWMYAGTAGGVLTLIGLGWLAAAMYRVEKKRRQAAGPAAG